MTQPPVILGLRAALGALALCSAPLADILYVDADLVTGAGDGSSWSDAFQGEGGLQSALAAASSGDQIYAAAGTYLPSSSGSRTATFQLSSGVEVYGSFLGTESSPAERPPFGTAPSILSGDLAGNDGGGFFGENSFHIVRGTGANNTAILDGFDVVSGTANGAGANQDRGAGIVCLGGSPRIANCRFLSNRCTFGGAAGYINSGGGPRFTDCTFEDGDGGAFGGAFDIANGGNVRFDRCLFAGNTADRAGALEVFSSGAVRVYSCIFRDNVSTGSGGGGAIWVGANSTVRIRNTTVVGNSATSNAVGGLRIDGAPSTDAANCIFWDNSGPGGAQGSGNQINAGNTVTYSIVEGGYPGTGNLASDPLLVDIASGDVTPTLSSPGVDAGDNGDILSGTGLDFGSAPRQMDVVAIADTGVGPAPIVDMGAVELSPCGVQVASAEASRTGAVPNPDVFLPGQTSGPVLGQVWDPQVDHTSFLPGAIGDFVFFSTSAVDVDLGPIGSLLCNVPFLITLLNATPAAPFAIPIPDDCSLVGIQLCSQAGSSLNGASFELTNALDITLGAY